MRLPRMTMRRWMIAVAVLAAAFAAIAEWMGVDRYQSRQHLNTEMTWSRSPVGEFCMEYDHEWHPANSLLKVSELGAPDREGRYYRHRWCVGGVGQLYEERYFRKALGTGSFGEQHYLTATELVQLQQIILKLPPSMGPYSQGDVLLVSSLSEGSWVTKVYDKAALPPAVQDIVRVLQLKFR